MLSFCKANAFADAGAGGSARPIHGFNCLFNYTFSTSLDNIPYASNNSFAQPGQSYVLPVYGSTCCMVA